MNFQKHLFYIALLSMCISNAQTEFRSGYIILKDKDTLFGEIDYRADRLMARVCTFKKDKTVLKYAPKDIEAYRFTNGKYFVSRNVNGKFIFLQFLIQGKLNVFYYKENKTNQDFYFLENDKSEFKEIPYKEKIVAVDGKDYYYEAKRYKGILAIFTAAAPELKSQINSIDKPEHNNLIELAKNYHNAICDTEKCIVHKAKRRKSKVSLEVQAGVFVFDKKLVTNETLDSEIFQSSILAHFSIPSLGDKWYFKTGVLYSQAGSRNAFEVPLHIEYIHFKGRVRPRFSYGIDVYKIFLPSLTAGVNVQLTESLFWSINTSLKFVMNEHLFFLPGKFMGGSINSGLFFTL